MAWPAGLGIEVGRANDGGLEDARTEDETGNSVVATDLLKQRGWRARPRRQGDKAIWLPLEATPALSLRTKS